MRKLMFFLIQLPVFISCEPENTDIDWFLEDFETFDNEGMEAILLDEARILLLTSHLKYGEADPNYAGTNWNIELQRYDK